MKNFKLILSAILLTVSMSASAQFANQGSSSSKGGSRSGILVKDCSNYNRFSLSYAPLNIKPTYNGNSYDSQTLQGFKLGWTGGFSVSKKLPIFVETGFDLFLNTKKVDGEYGLGDFGDDWDADDLEDYEDYLDDDDSDWSTRSTMMGVTVPVNVSYKLTFNNGVYVAPYFGIHFKINVLGKDKYKYTGDDDDEDDDDDDDDLNWFSKKDMGGSKYTFNRFQMGWRIGANVGYKKLNLNLGYAGDISPLYKEGKFKLKTGGVVIGLGVNF